MMGSFRNVSEAHLYRDLAEFDFSKTPPRERAEKADTLLKGAKGKRLMCYQPSEATKA